MEPYENVAKERAHKTMMTKNAPADVAFALISAEYDTHLLQYSRHIPRFWCGQNSSETNRKQDAEMEDIRPLFLRHLHAVLTSKPALMEAYLADLARGDALKNARGTL